MVSPSYSLEFAYQFLGDVYGKTIVALRCGGTGPEGILASLGARVISLEIDKDRHAVRFERLPIEDGRAHAVLSNSILSHVDALPMARQIRRILKPGGIAVFHQPASSLFPLEQAGAVSRAVGRPGRLQLGLSLRFVECTGIRDSRLIDIAQRIDNWILGKFPSVHSFAAPLVWEARKES